MNKKLILALSLVALTYNVNSASLFDLSLGKKCYEIAKRLTLIEQAQTLSVCKDRLHAASSYAESAALTITVDEIYGKYYLDDAISMLKQARMYSCVNEEGIIAEQQNLLAIKEQFNPVE